MSYPIGMICIGQNFANNLERNGMECKIKSVLGDGSITGRSSGKRTKGFVYLVEWEDGPVTSQLQSQLRPKHEPGSWDELEKMIGWRPGVVRPYLSITYKEKQDD